MKWSIWITDRTDPHGRWWAGTHTSGGCIWSDINLVYWTIRRDQDDPTADPTATYQVRERP